MKSLQITTTIIAVMLLLCGVVFAADGPVASWNFDEGTGNLLHDSSGNNCNGDIKGARWVKSGNGYALRFDGENDYVNCGNPAALNFSGPYTLEIWVNPDAPTKNEPGIIGKFPETYCMTTYQGSVYLYVNSGGNNTFAPLKAGEWTHIVGTFDGETMRIYENGVEVAKKKSGFSTIKSGGSFLMGCFLGDTSSTDDALRATNYFAGMMDSARAYNRAISSKEVLESYNRESKEKGREPLDPDLIGEFGLQKFLYPENNMAALSVNYRWMNPLPADSKIEVGLYLQGESSPLEVRSLKIDPALDTVEAEFSTDHLLKGDYVLRAELVSASGQRSAASEQTFSWPVEAAPMPSPKAYTVPSLPVPVTAPAYSVNVNPKGGFTVKVKNSAFRIESSFSYPKGGENGFSVDLPTQPESAWKVSVKQTAKNTWAVTGEGQYYTLQRSITAKPNRIEVSDTFKNKTSDVLGIIFFNAVNVRGIDGAKIGLPANPSVYASVKDAGAGIVALDDVYYTHFKNRNDDGVLKLTDDQFGLGPGASKTIKWAVYPTSTPDYFEMVNRVRKDEKINGRCEGAVRLTGEWGPPSEFVVKVMNTKYPSIAYLTHAMTTPRHISLEGWEYMEYPEVCNRLRKAFSDTYAKYPDIYPLYHVAHTLYFTNKPYELFTDSLPVNQNGKASCYGPDSWDYYGHYTDRQTFDEGTRWWNFYPTMTNNFGKLQLRAAEYMVKNLGAKTVWLDGYVDSYVRGGYMYNKDIWDGCSVDIDPQTKTVIQKKSSLFLVGREALVNTIRIYNKAGGPGITNGNPGPFSYLRDCRVITSCETGGGDQQPIAALYFGSTVTPLGNPANIHTERDLYNDMVTKMDLGALYFWYGDNDLVKGTTPVTYMYPITFQEIHPGTVVGTDRVITDRTGVYGWQGDKSLHIVHLFDPRGKEVANHFVSTVDKKGARTALELGKNESAVVVKVPATLDTKSSANVLVTSYNENGLTLKVSGSGSGVLKVRSGDFRIKPGGTYLVNGKPAKADAKGTLTVSTPLSAETMISVK